MTQTIAQSSRQESSLPSWVIWIQCAAFVVLYAVWILPEIVGFRNTALVTGAIFGAYSIYQYRKSLLQKSALPIWLMVALFGWATFHLVFLSSDYALQYVEFLRIWKYAAIGAVMATGLGLSLINSDTKESGRYWFVIYFGLCTPCIIYLIKYTLTMAGRVYGLDIPIYMQVYNASQPFYVPKTDYVAFCLPAFAIALGSLIRLSDIDGSWRLKNLLSLVAQILIISGTLFLFAAQNIKNGIVYAAVLFIIFGVMYFADHISSMTWKKAVSISCVFIIFVSAIAFNINQNATWKTLIADTKVAFQLEEYPHWRDAAKYGYPVNEYGAVVSVTNYERAAWAKVGLLLSIDTPLGYGLIEDSFAKMAKLRWPDVGKNLSHSHSGWLDVLLAIGYPGFLLLLIALLLVIRTASLIRQPWAILAFWAPLSILFLWCTTEVSATITFAALIFWVCLGSSLAVKIKCIDKRTELRTVKAD